MSLTICRPATRYCLSPQPTELRFHVANALLSLLSGNGSPNRFDVSGLSGKCRFSGGGCGESAPRHKWLKFVLRDYLGLSLALISPIALSWFLCPPFLSLYPTMPQELWDQAVRHEEDTTTAKNQVIAEMKEQASQLQVQPQAHLSRDYVPLHCV